MARYGFLRSADCSIACWSLFPGQRAFPVELSSVCLSRGEFDFHGVIFDRRVLPNELNSDEVQFSAVFCSSCGASNVDGAAFCSKCGAPLTAATAPPPVIPSPQIPPSTSGLPPGGRNPLAAAILNFFFGIGYIYLGYKRVLGIPTVLFVILVLILEIIVGFFTIGILSLIIGLFLAYDGFVKAKGQRGYLNTEPGIGYQH